MKIPFFLLLLFYYEKLKNVEKANIQHILLSLRDIKYGTCEFAAMCELPELSQYIVLEKLTILS